MKNRALILIIAGVIVVLAVIAVIVIESRGSNTPVTPAKVSGAADVENLLRGIPQQNTALGQQNAPVTMVEFADLKCPICQKFSTTVLPEIITNYVRTGKLRIILQYQTFVGRQSAPGDSQHGAEFGLAAGMQNKLWDFTELFYHNQQNEDKRYVTDDFLRKLGSQIPGLSVQQAFAETGSSSVSQEISSAQNAFKLTGFDGVPSFQIGKTNGPLTNIPAETVDYGSFQKAIDNLL